MRAFPGLKILFFPLLSFCLGACAVDRPPSGGPPDTSALTVTSSVPEPGAVEASTESIRLDFSHAVSREELSGSIFFSPAVENYRISTQGKHAVIHFDRPLKKNATWTLTLRKPLRSFYGAHQLEQSWSLAFSTGKTIMQGSIEGRIWNDRMAPAPDVTVAAYAITAEHALPGTAKPVSRPDYVTQSDASGNFALQNIAPGRYRIIAFSDANANLRPDFADEPFGVSSVPLVEPGMKTLALRLNTESLSTPSLRSCLTINDREIQITFSRPVAVRTVTPASLRIETTVNGTVLPVLGVFSPSRKNEESTFRVLTAPMDKETIYRIVRLPEIPGAESSALTFSGNARKESYPGLSVRILPSDGSSEVLPETIRSGSGGSAELQFNLPVIAASVGKAVTLTASGKNGEREETVTIDAIDSRTFSVRPADGFRQNTDYRLTVNTGRVQTPIGSKAETSAETSRFSTAAADAYGEISGTGTATAPFIILEARKSGTDAAQRLLIRPVRGAFSFSFRTLPPGEYTITGFIPSASRQATTATRWSGGSTAPFVPSDPFAAVKIEVRPGWSTEKIRLDIPSPRQSRP